MATEQATITHSITQAATEAAKAAVYKVIASWERSLWGREMKQEVWYPTKSSEI